MTVLAPHPLADPDTTDALARSTGQNPEQMRQAARRIGRTHRLLTWRDLTALNVMREIDREQGR